MPESAFAVEDTMIYGAEDDIPADVGDEEIIELDEEEQDCEPKFSAPDPGCPTQKQIELHREDHTPYRCWCEHCVKGRGVGEHHTSSPESTVPIVSFDYLIVTRRWTVVHRNGAGKHEVPERDILLKILVVKDSFSRAIFAHVVPQKGVGEHRFAADRLRNDILWMGHRRVLLRCDNEPAIKKLLVETLKEFNVSAMDQVAEKSPAPHDSKGNGSIENAIRQVQGLLRTMKSCLEERLQCRIPSNHAVMWWLVEHVAWTLTTRHRGTDGKAAYERLRGRPFTKRTFGFGEQCLAKTHWQ